MFLADQASGRAFGNVGPTLTWLNLESNEEVDELYREWSASNARLLSAPESKPWGLHEFTAADLDGNLFRVFHDFATQIRTRALAFTKDHREGIRRGEESVAPCASGTVHMSRSAEPGRRRACRRRLDRGDIARDRDG